MCPPVWSAAALAALLAIFYFPFSKFRWCDNDLVWLRNWNHVGCAMLPLSRRVLALFREMGKDRLDLHILFEAAGNEPVEREHVLDAIEELLHEGLLESRGGDFYALTEKGWKAITQP